VRILILGGSWFLGYVIAEHARRRGHDVTVFNRGRSPWPAAGITGVRGDRASQSDLRRLASSGPWDAVVDVQGLVPAQVRDSAAILSGNGCYLFVSSISAYQRWPDVPVSEESEVRDADPDFDPGGWQWDEHLYGYMKAGSECAIAREYPAQRRIILRPTIILGPREYSARLTWWLERVARGGSILAPGRPGRVIQPVDVRDVAAFTVWLIEQRLCGTYNVAAPDGYGCFGDLLSACRDVTNSDGEFVWVGEDWLSRMDVAQWTELPLWRMAKGTWAVDASLAARAGFACRPLGDTVADTWRWLVSGARPVPHERQLTNGIDPQKERRILAAWNAGPARDDEGDTDEGESQPVGSRSERSGSLSRRGSHDDSSDRPTGRGSHHQ